MRSLAKWIVVVSCLAMAACAEPLSTSDSGGAKLPPLVVIPDVDPGELLQAELQSYWDWPLVLPAGERIVRLYRLDEKLYCLTNMNTLVAINAQVGKEEWRRSIAPIGQAVFAPTHVNDIVLPEEVVGIEGIVDPSTIRASAPFDAVMINSLSYVMVLDRKDGAVIRNPKDVRFDFAANTSGASDGVMFFVGSVNGRYYGMDLVAGVMAWQEGTGAIISSGLKYVNEHLYVAGEDGVFYTDKITTGREFDWSQQLGGPVTADFYVGDNQCFVPCEDKRLYAYGALNGQQIWPPFVTSGKLRTPVQVAPQTIFQYAQGDRLYAIDRLTGEKRWDMPDGRTVLAAMEGKAYVLDKEKMMHVVDEMTGEEIATVDMSRLDLLLANTTAPAIFAAGKDGKLYCFRLLSAGRLTPEMLEAGEVSR